MRRRAGRRRPRQCRHRPAAAPAKFRRGEPERPAEAGGEVAVAGEAGLSTSSSAVRSSALRQLDQGLRQPELGEVRVSGSSTARKSWVGISPETRQPRRAISASPESTHRAGSGTSSRAPGGAGCTAPAAPGAVPRRERRGAGCDQEQLLRLERLGAAPGQPEEAGPGQLEGRVNPPGTAAEERMQPGAPARPTEEFLEERFVRGDDDLGVPTRHRLHHPELLARSNEQRLVRIARPLVASHLPDEESTVGQHQLGLQGRIPPSPRPRRARSRARLPPGPARSAGRRSGDPGGLAPR